MAAPRGELRRDLIRRKGGVHDTTALTGQYQLIDDALIGCYTLSGGLVLGKYCVLISGGSSHVQ